MKNRVIIVGCGRLGSSLATKLSMAGQDVVVLDTAEKSFRKLPETFSGFQLVGDGTDVNNLEYAGIKEAKMVLAHSRHSEHVLHVADNIGSLRAVR